MSEKLQWKVHTTELFKEISANFKHDAQIRIPLQILQNLLAQVAQRAIELDDPQLNKLMIRLTLYSVADPKDRDYNPEVVAQFLEGDVKSKP